MVLFVFYRFNVLGVQYIFEHVLCLLSLGTVRLYLYVRTWLLLSPHISAGKLQTKITTIDRMYRGVLVQYCTGTVHTQSFVGSSVWRVNGRWGGKEGGREVGREGGSLVKNKWSGRPPAMIVRDSSREARTSHCLQHLVQPEVSEDYGYQCIQ